MYAVKVSHIHSHFVCAHWSCCVRQFRSDPLLCASMYLGARVDSDAWLLQQYPHTLVEAVTKEVVGLIILTHSLTYLTHSITHSLAQLLIHLRVHSLTHSSIH